MAKNRKKSSSRTTSMPVARGMDRRYQIEEDARTLLRAAEIRQSRARLAPAKVELARQAAAAKAAMKGK